MSNRPEKTQCSVAYALVIHSEFCLQVVKVKSASVDSILGSLRSGYPHPSASVAIASYDTFREYVDAFNEVSWHIVVCDEAHKLKNGSSKVHLACASIHTPFRYALTGTAMPNSPMELYHLMEWAIPNYFGASGTPRSVFCCRRYISQVTSIIIYFHYRNNVYWCKVSR